MGSIGPLEIVVILVVALVVLGPNRLPDAARSVGKAMAELRRMTTGFQTEVRDAFAEPPSTPKAPAEPVALPVRPEDADITASLGTLPDADAETVGPAAAEPLGADQPVADQPLAGPHPTD